MKLRAKIILTAASLALSCALLAGCGSSSGSTASSAASSEPASTVLSQASSIPLGEDNSTDALNAPFETLLNANPISNQFEIAAMNIEYDFNLPAEDVVSYKGVKSNDNGDAGMVLVVEAADGKAEEVANQLTAYQQDQVAFYGNYAEFAQAPGKCGECRDRLQGQHRGHGHRFQRVHCRSGQRGGQRTGRVK